ncbi:Pleiotropic negative transcriptional regulator [Chamberlinius hualienensis]
MAASTSGCGVYRSKDPFKNFKIRIKIEKCSSEYPSTPVVDNSGNSNIMEMQEFSCLESLKTPNLELVEDRVISWQEKIFNDSEIQKYSNETTCQTPLQKKYNRLLQTDGSNARCRNVLFTYTNEDEPVISNRELTSPHFSTNLVSNVTNLRNRKSGSPEWDTRNVINKRGSNPNPTRLEQQVYHSLLTAVESMWIMALIKDDEALNEVDLSTEILLVKVCIDSKGAITVAPDFNSGKRPYRLHIPGKKDIYYYTFEHASNKITEDSVQEAKLLLASLPKAMKEHLNHEFKFSDPSLLRVYVFGEIVSAQQFEFDSLSVQCLLDLPEKWTSDGDKPMFRATQTCKTKCVSNNEIAYFSYPFEYEMSCPLSHLIAEDIGNLSRQPCIAFHVISTDWWQRFRTEGYGYLSVPLTAGIYTYEIQTWRPVVPSLSSKLRRLFIGGSPELSDISQVAVPPTLKGSYISRYGMRTETSGVLRIRLHVVRQCLQSLEFDHYCNSSFNDIQSMQKDVAEVIEAFHQARQRMLKARDSSRF